MSEQQQDKLEMTAPEAVENNAEQPVADDRENAPAEKKKEAKPARKKARKRKKKRGVPVVAVAVIVVVAMFFGVVLGYGLGRNNSSGKLEEAKEQIDELTELVVETNEKEFDVFTDALTGENEAALDVLSGNQEKEDSMGQTAAMMSGEAFGRADAGDGEDVIVAEFKGGSITGSELSDEYNQQMTSFIFAGFSEAELADTLLQEVAETMVSDRVLQSQAAGLGLTELSGTDKARIEAEAKASYEEQLLYCRTQVAESGMSEAEITAAAEKYLKETEGVTYDSVYADLEEGWWSQKLYEHVTKGVSVDSADVLKLYQSKLADQKANFSAYPDDFEYAQRNGEVIVYNLSGYRAVKLLTLGFEDESASTAVFELREELEGLDADSDLARISEIQNQLNSYYSTPEDEAKAVVEQLAAGKDFDSLLEQYGEDEGMKDPARRATGYYVSANSVLWDKETISAAMHLEKPGDVSAPVRTGDGVCILSYIGDVAPGDVPMDRIVDALTEEALVNAQLAAYEAQVETWIQEADVKYYMERMQ